MVTPKTTLHVKDAIDAFKTSVIDDAGTSALTPGEKHWMEELSCVYLCTELDVSVPQETTGEFKEKLARMKQFGGGSALSTRLFTYAMHLISEPDFHTNTAAFLATIERHKNHWSQQCLTAHEFYTDKQPVEDFMRDYFDNPTRITQTELTYFLAFYFKHFYRLLYDFLLVYTQGHTPVYYGNAHI